MSSDALLRRRWHYREGTWADPALDSADAKRRRVWGSNDSLELRC